MSTSNPESYLKRAISLLEQAELELKSIRKWRMLDFFDRGRNTYEKLEHVRKYLNKVQDMLDKLESEYKHIYVPPNASLNTLSLNKLLGIRPWPVLFGQTKAKRCLAEILGLKANLEDLLYSFEDKNKKFNF